MPWHANVSIIVEANKESEVTRYVDGDLEGIQSINIDGTNVTPKHFRNCLSNLSGFKGDPHGPEGKEALKTHLRKTMRVSPDGVSTITISSKLLPIRAFPIGDLKYIKFLAISASSLPTILYVFFFSTPKSLTVTVDPKIILPLFSIFNVDFFCLNLLSICFSKLECRCWSFTFHNNSKNLGMQFKYH